MFSDEDVVESIPDLFTDAQRRGHDNIVAALGARYGFSLDTKKIGHDKQSAIEAQASRLLLAIRRHEQREDAKDVYWMKRSKGGAGTQEP